MKIALLGFDTEGRVSYDYFQAHGHDLTICDKNTETIVPQGVASVLGPSYLDNLDRFDLVVRTAGLPPGKILEKNPGIESKITSHINEFLKASPTHNIIGVTGTKGKGTTSTLIAKMLEAAGNDVQLGGNIGVPPLSFISSLTPDSWVVLELSSFQLSDLRMSPHIAICLAVVAEHLDWHGTIEDYVLAKSLIFAWQKPNDVAIYYAHDEISQRIAARGKARKLPFFQTPGAFVDNGSVTIDQQVICQTSELKLLGRHNWQNVCAAVTAVWQVSKDVEVMRKVLTTFSGLEHRIELVREVDGVKFYNDSYASGLQATEAAIEAVDGKKVVIVGGYDRQLTIDRFGVYVADHQSDFRRILVIGESAQRLADCLKAAGFTNYIVGAELKTMQAIVESARSLAQPGDSVLLSPGFASFDMFKNFSDRGEQFKKVVQAL